MVAPRLWTRPFVLVSLTHLAVATGGGMLFVHLPGYLKELGAGEFVIGNVMAITALTAMASGPLVGRMLDRHGRKRVLTLGATLFACCCALYLRVDELGPLLYAIRAIEGVADVALYAALFTTAADLVPAQRRTEGLAIFGSAGLVAIGMSAELGDFLLRWAGFDALFLCACGIALVGLCLAVPLRDVEREAAADASAEGGFLAALSQPDLRPVWAVALVFFLAMAGVLTFMKTFVMGLPFADVGGFFAAYSAVAVGLRWFAGWLPDRVGPARLLGPAFACYGVGMFLLIDVQSSLELVLAGAVCGIGHGYTFPILFSLVVTRSRPDSRGAATGIYTTIDWLGHLVGGPALGLLIEYAGYATLFRTTAAGIALTASAFYLWDRRVGDRPATLLAR